MPLDPTPTRPVDAGPVTFEPPDGFDDLTGYVFRADDGSELTVHPPGPAYGRPPKEAVAVYLNQLVRLAGRDGLRFEEIGAELDQWLVARTVFRDGRRWVRERRAFGLIEGRLASIAHLTPLAEDPAAEDSAASARFLGVLRSVAGGETLPGYIRRATGAVSLLVPPEYRPPTAHQYVSPSTEVRVSLKIAPAEAAPPPGFGTTAEAAALHNAAVTPVPDYEGIPMVKLIRVGSTGEEIGYACHATRSFGPCIVYVSGQCGSQSSAEQMQRVVAGVVDSLKERK